MATHFELWFDGEESAYHAEAARAAFDLLDRIEAQLSLFRENSDVNRVNRWAGRGWVPVNPHTFALLERCLALQEESGGGFDVTAALGRSSPVGRKDPMIGLDRGSRTVMLRSQDARLDLGGIGKGYALDQLAGLLRDWDLERALLVGGGSSMLALGEPKGRQGWPVRVEGRQELLQLSHQALGVSGQAQGAHIIDPRSGLWVEDSAGAWCLARDAATADALSTACVVLGAEAVERLRVLAGVLAVGFLVR